MAMMLADSIFDSLEGFGMWACIAVIVVCGAACDIAKRFMRHRERMAKIQAGVDPDLTPRPADEQG